MKKLVGFIVFSLLLILINSVVYSQVDITVPDTVLSLNADEEFFLPVYTSSLDGLGVVSIQFDFTFDTLLLDFAGIKKNNTLSSTFFISANEISPGLGRVAGAGSSAIQGEGVLIYLKFKLLRDGISNINITNFKFQDDGPTANITNGTVTKIFDQISNTTLRYGLKSYPNPFNPETTIEYRIPEPSQVSMEIYNILGQKIKTLVNDKKFAGLHNVKWNGRNDNGIKVKSGLYLYKLQADDFVEVKKMVLLK